jgi:AcrR family transcriptional regulator
MSDESVRKQPRQERAKETVALLYEAILKLLANEDKDPSMAAIAARAGVSVGSVYQYFPSKRSLVSRVLAYYVEKRAKQLAKDLEGAAGLPAEQAATFLVNAVLGVGRKRTALDRAMVEFILKNGDIHALLSQDEAMVSHIERYLESLGDQIRPMNTRMAAFFILNALRPAVPLAIHQRPEWLDDEAFAAEMRTLIVNYLRK